MLSTVFELYRRNIFFALPGITAGISYGFLALLIIVVTASGRKIRLQGFFLWGVLYLVSILLSNIYSSMGAAYFFLASRDIVIPFLIFSLVAAMSDQERHALEQYWTWLAEFIVVTSVVSGGYQILAGRYNVDSATGFFSSGTANTIGYMVAIYFVYQLVSRGFGGRLIYLAVAMMILSAKGALLLAVAVALVHYLTDFRDPRQLIRGTLMGGIIALSVYLGGSYFLGSKDFFSVNNLVKAYNAESQVEGGTAAARVYFLNHALSVTFGGQNMLTTLLGNGPGSFYSPAGYALGNKELDFLTYLEADVARNGVVASSQIGNLIYEAGIFGFLMFELFYISVLKRFISRGERIGAYAISILIASQVFTYLPSLTEFLFFFWVLVALRYFKIGSIASSNFT